MRKVAIFCTVFASFSFLAKLLMADYTLVLKNGRRITAQSYREEGLTIKIPVLGGEVGIPKDQIQTILKAGETGQRGLSITDLGASRHKANVSSPVPSPAQSGEAIEQSASEETKPGVSAEEEKEYQERLAEVNAKLEAAQQAFLRATQGGDGFSDVSKEGLRGWTSDFGSRIRDSQKVPGGGGPPNTPPMPPYAPTYTPGEKRISDLRSLVDSLKKEREDLVTEMKSKNIPTGIP